MEYDGKKCVIFLDFFMNFVSSCAQYMDDELMYKEYVPKTIILNY
jgi:hypothetical protein